MFYISKHLSRLLDRYHFAELILILSIQLTAGGGCTRKPDRMTGYCVVDHSTAAKFRLLLVVCITTWTSQRASLHCDKCLGLGGPAAVGSLDRTG